MKAYMNCEIFYFSVAIIKRNKILRSSDVRNRDMINSTCVVVEDEGG